MENKINTVDPRLARLDALGLQWYHASDDKNSSVRKNCELQIFELIFKLIKDIYREDIITFWEKDFRKYDPEKGEFSKFCKSRIIFRYRDRMRKENKNKPIDVPEPGPTPGPTPPPDGGQAMALLLELMTIIQKMDSMLPGKSNNPTRKKYLRLFYTDTVTSFIRNSDDYYLYINHERDVICEMELTLIDYIMASICRTFKDLHVSDTKMYSELVSEGPKKYIKFPLAYDIYISYMNHTEGVSVSEAAISQQHKHYTEYCKALR